MNTGTSTLSSSHALENGRHPIAPNITFYFIKEVLKFNFFLKYLIFLVYSRLTLSICISVSNFVMKSLENIS